MMPWFTIGQARIPSYPVMALAGAVIACFVFYKTAVSRRWEKRSIAFVLIAAFAAFFLGAKLFNAWVDHAVEGSRMLAFIAAPSGFSLYGALMGGALAVFIVSYLVRRNGLEGLDLFALSASFGCGMGRVGCLLAGCCHGRPTLFPMPSSFQTSTPR